MMNDAKGTDRTLEGLSEDYAELKSQKDGLAGQIKQLEESLDELKKELKEQFGSDELEKLQQLLEEKEAENRQKSQQYGEHLDELKEQLAALEETVESDQPADENEDHAGDES
jgi:septal ring factor EnvC (AmiA/AmiB activator)